MKKQQQLLVSAIAAVILMGIPALAKSSANKPLKIIASDLIIETAEQGEFLDDPADPRHFKPSNVVGKKCGLFGWRMKVKTTRKEIAIQEKSSDGKSNGTSFRQVPKYGYLYAAVPFVAGVSPGKYTVIVFVENVPVKTFIQLVK